MQSADFIISRRVILVSSQCSTASIALHLLCFEPSTSNGNFLLSATIAVDVNLELRLFVSDLECP